MTVAELARRTRADAESLRRLLRSLAAVGMFTTDGEQVAVTDLGALLSEHHPQSFYDFALMWRETHYLPFSQLLDGVRTGRPAAQDYRGEPFFDWMERDPARGGLFSRAMAEVTSSLRTGMFDDYRLPAGGTVADLGASDDSVLVGLLTRDADPERRGIVFDLPSVARLAEKTLAASGLGDRVDIVPGDFSVEVPQADTYLLGHILHDWDDASCRRLLGSIRQAAGAGARLLLVEVPVPLATDPISARPWT